MPLIDKHESSTGSTEWFRSECSRGRTFAEENEWSSRHAALFVDDWLAIGPKDYDWIGAGAMAAAQQCEILINESLGEHFKVYSGDFNGISTPLNSSNPKIAAVKVKAEELRVEFEALSKRWQRDTRHLSLISKKITHSAYLRIIGMGEAAIPLILESLRAKSAHWFVALRATANTDPSTPEDTPSQAREAWIAWGISKGYIE